MSTRLLFAWVIAISSLMVTNSYGQLTAKDSSLFAHQYNGDVYDPFENFAGGSPFPGYIQQAEFPTTPTTDGNILTVNMPGGGPYFDGNATWNGTHTTGFTIEFRIKIDPSSQDGPWGTFGVYYGDGGAGDIFSVAKSKTFSANGTITSDTHDNTDGFHVFRIAEYANGAAGPVNMYRDGVLIQQFANGGNWGGNTLYFGSGGSPLGPGKFDLDYFRWDSTGAYAPPKLLGDLNQDQHVNATDINVMMSALSDLPTYESNYGVQASDLLSVVDVNNDHVFTNADLQSLLNYLKSGNGSSQVVPEPSAFLLISLGAVGMMLKRLQHRKQIG